MQIKLDIMQNELLIHQSFCLYFRVGFTGVRVAQSLVFMCILLFKRPSPSTQCSVAQILVFCSVLSRSLFLTLFCFILLCCLSFGLRLLITPFWYLQTFFKSIFCLLWFTVDFITIMFSWNSRYTKFEKMTY